MTDDPGHDVETIGPEEEIKRLKARLAELEGEPLVFKQSQLRDPAYFFAHRDAILKAAAEGRVVMDVSRPGARPAVTDAVKLAARSAGEAAASRGRFSAGRPGQAQPGQGGAVGPRVIDAGSTIPRVDRPRRTGEL